MSVITSPIAAPPAAPAARPHRLALETTGRGDVLVRTLALLRRRGCRIVAVDFREADRHGPGRFEVAVEPPPRTGHRVEAWLLGLVDVVRVVDAGAG
jgi:acetolactate synthase regulatory subunit